MNELSRDDVSAQRVAVIATPHASRYLQQLCKHFAHKLPATFDTANGLIAFSIGECRLNARKDSLAMSVSAPDAAHIGTLQEVIARHLTRFAFREDLHVKWHPA